MLSRIQPVIATLLLLIASFNPAYAQKKIVRNPEDSKLLTGKELPFEKKRNVLQDFQWTTPDVKSHQLKMEGNTAKFSYGGMSYSLLCEADKLVLTPETGKALTSYKRITNKYYPVALKLSYKAVAYERQVEKMVYTVTTVPVQKSRSVGRPGTGTSGEPTTIYTSETYTVYENRQVGNKELVWETQTFYVPVVPDYSGFLFDLENGDQLMIYEVQEGGQKAYYFQHTDYLIATDNNIKYLLLDANSDGDYFDDADQVMFNTWNPHDKDAKFVGYPAFKDNKWCALGTLRQHYFINIEKGVAANSVKIFSENQQYAGNEATGKVAFSGLPDKCILTVNGKEYKTAKNKAEYKAEFGKYKAVISAKGLLDYETTFEVNDKNPEVAIAYAGKGAGSELVIKDVFSTNYFVTIKAENGYERLHGTQSKINVPAGKITLVIEDQGYTVIKELTVVAGQELSFNFTDEMKVRFPGK